MTYRTRRRLRRILRSTVIALILALVLCEVGLRALVASAPPGPIDNSHIEERLNPNLPQYAHSPYYSVDFVWGIHKIFAYRYINDDGQVATHDLAVNGYTIKNDQRVTSDQPERYDRTVWMFGSSTVWGAYVDDAHTIPSYLQREFNRRGLRWRVINMGQPGIDITIENYWMRKSDIRMGDLVIFIDGSVDMDDMLRLARKNRKNDTLSCRLSDSIPLLVLAFWCQSNATEPIPQAYLDAAMKVEYTRYWRNISEGRAYASSKGAEYVHFMQPDLGRNLDSYALLVRGYTLRVDRADYFDAEHYDDDGHAALAVQIAGVVTGF